jgi:antitoxin PrlF
VLQHLGVGRGEKVMAELLPDGRVELRAPKALGSIESFIGCAARPGTKPLSVEEIGEIAADGWAGRC